MSPEQKEYVGGGFCAVHTEVVQSLGRVEGRVEVVVEKLTSIDSKLDTLNRNGAKDRLSAAVEKQKIRPVYWLFMTIGGAIIIGIVETIIHFWIKR